MPLLRQAYLCPLTKNGWQGRPPAESPSPQERARSPAPRQSRSVPQARKQEEQSAEAHQRTAPEDPAPVGRFQSFSAAVRSPFGKGRCQQPCAQQKRKRPHDSAAAEQQEQGQQQGGGAVEQHPPCAVPDPPGAEVNREIGKRGKRSTIPNSTAAALRMASGRRKLSSPATIISTPDVVQSRPGKDLLTIVASYPFFLSVASEKEIFHQKKCPR